MKGLTVAGCVLLAAFTALTPAIGALYGQIYPADPAKREALVACTQANPEFSRLWAAARAACYEQRLAPPQAKPGVVPSPSSQIAPT